MGHATGAPGILVKDTQKKIIKLKITLFRLLRS
jgi:hypothetical protein